MVDILALRQHVIDLGYKADLDRFVYVPRDQDSFCDLDSYTIGFPFIRNVINYQSAMHEFGHYFSESVYTETSYSILMSELEAWDWAYRNSLLWTLDMNEEMGGAMKSYWREHKEGVNILAPEIRTYCDLMRRGFKPFVPRYYPLSL